MGLTLGIQINRLFPLDDVMHLVIARTPPPKTTRIEYGDLKGYDTMITSTKMPTHAVLSFEANRIHLFLHDNEFVRRCVWDGPVTFDEKKDILYNMITWWKDSNHTCLDQNLVNYEDGVVFTDVISEIQESFAENAVSKDLHTLDLEGVCAIAKAHGLVVPIGTSRDEAIALIEAEFDDNHS